MNLAGFGGKGRKVLLDSILRLRCDLCVSALKSAVRAIEEEDAAAQRSQRRLEEVNQDVFVQSHRSYLKRCEGLVDNSFAQGFGDRFGF